jgi:hypothetical protein
MLIATMVVVVFRTHNRLRSEPTTTRSITGRGAAILHLQPVFWNRVPVQRFCWECHLGTSPRWATVWLWHHTINSGCFADLWLGRGLCPCDRASSRRHLFGSSDYRRHCGARGVEMEATTPAGPVTARSLIVPCRLALVENMAQAVGRLGHDF